MELNEFIKSLPTLFPEARFDLLEPALDEAEALARLDEVCAAYADIARCEDDLANEAEYTQYKKRLSTVLGATLEKTDEVMETVLKNGAIIASVIDLIIGAGAVHPLEAAMTTAEMAAHKFDALTTAGASILASIGIGKAFDYFNDPKREDIARLTARVCLKARLAKALVEPGRINEAERIISTLGDGASVAQK